MQCAGNDCWRPSDLLGHVYRGDSDASADGAQSLKLLGGAAGKSKILLKAANNSAKGRRACRRVSRRRWPDSTSATVQIHGSDAPACFSTTLSTVREGHRDFFKAK